MKKAFFLGSVVLCFLLLASAAWGACHVITPAGSGTKSGSDWNNACAGFTGTCANASLVRGDTYYLGKGTYNGGTFSKANSSTLRITVKAPTAGDHCIDTGFNETNHVGQALFNGSTTIDSDFWTFDGQFGTEFVKGSYGIKFKWVSGNTNDALYCQNGCDSSTFRFVEVQGSNFTNSFCDEGMLVTGYNHSPNDTSNVTIDHLYGYDSSNIVKVKSSSNITVQNSVLGDNYSRTTCHGENLAFDSIATLVVRNNTFINCGGTACIANPNAVTENSSNLQIYGNLFYDDRGAGACVDNGGTLTCLGNGIITTLGGGTWTGVKIYNNTVANWTSGKTSAGNSLRFYFNSGGSVSGMEMVNNLFFNNVPVSMGNQGTCLSNSFYNTTRSSAACSGDQVTSGNPFVNSSGTGAAADFNLTADTAAWTSLASPFNTDPNGTTRTSSRGAFQFTGPRPDPPSGLGAVVR